MHVLTFWDLAAADFQKLSSFRNPPRSTRSICTPCCVFTCGDEAGYRAICEQMVKRFDNPGRSRGPGRRKRLSARACWPKSRSLRPSGWCCWHKRAVDAGRSASRLASLGTAYVSSAAV